MSECARRVYSGGPWEMEVAYCRAIVRAGWACVSGTCAIGDDGRVIAPGNPYEQALACLSKIRRALEELGIPLANVVRTRIYVTRIEDWKHIARAHHEYFAHHPPVTTMVQVARLIDPELLV